MNRKYRIAILGIGAVGGYIGGLLADKYCGESGVEVIFLARNENKNRILENGLKLITTEGEKIVRPFLVTDDPRKCGAFDLFICTVKTYDLTEAIRHYEKNIASHTIILPLENGVDAAEKIRKVLQGAHIWKGCVYVNARLLQPGIVSQIGTSPCIFFGSPSAAAEDLRMVEKYFNDAGIDARVPENILLTIWEKFVFISSIATITSYLDATVGKVLSSQSNKNLLHTLLNEAISVAHAKNILLPDQLIHKLMQRAANMPFDATSSMHTDFRNKKKTELDSLTGYIIKEANQFHVPVPTYELMYGRLLER
jgi:2-dehydropantoate 2-reductase